MKIHALTLTWNGADLLSRLKESIMREYPGTIDHNNFVWHIRDNGSEDNTKDVVPGWAKLHEIEHNRANFAEGMNYLFEQAQPDDDDFVLLLNNDVVLNHNSFDYKNGCGLGNMIALQKLTEADVVGTVLTSGDEIKHAGVIFSRRYGHMPWHFRAGEKVGDHDLSQPRYLQAVTAACCLVRAGAWRQVGGMDEKFQWAFEDVDLCLKIGQLKERNIVCTGDHGIGHGESVSLRKNPVNKMFMGANVQHFKSRWWGKYKIDHDKYLRDSKYNEVTL